MCSEDFECVVQSLWTSYAREFVNESQLIAGVTNLFAPVELLLLLFILRLTKQTTFLLIPIYRVKAIDTL